MDNFDLKQYLTEGKLNEGGGYRRYYAFLEEERGATNKFVLVDITNQNDTEVEETIRGNFMDTFIDPFFDMEDNERDEIFEGIEVNLDQGTVYSEEDGSEVEFRFFEFYH